MTEILHSPQPLPSSPSPPTPNPPHDVLPQQLLNRSPVALSRSYFPTSLAGVRRRHQEGVFQFSVLEVFVAALRKSLVGCTSITTGAEDLMEIGSPTNVRHVAHVTYDRFNGFLGLPVEFEPEVPRRPPSASTRVFGVSTESMHLSFDSRGNCVPTILLMMQRRLYSQGGLQSEGIFRINPENGQEEYVREQLNNGLIPDNIDVHCLAGLIKAWFRELPRGILDTLSPEQVMQAQSEDDCTHLVRLLPPTEAALLDWAINLMADVAQLEKFNKMNARNIAMVFAPNMTQMSDPLTALMYAVQVMNFLKTLIVKTLRVREDSKVDEGRMMQLEPSDKDGHHNISKTMSREIKEESDEDEAMQPQSASSCPNPTTGASPSLATPKTHNDSHNCIADARKYDGIEDGRNQPTIQRARAAQATHSNCIRKGLDEAADKNRELSIMRCVNAHTELAEAWR